MRLPTAPPKIRPIAVCSRQPPRGRTRRDPRRTGEEDDKRNQRKHPTPPAPAGGDTGEETEGEARIPHEWERDGPRNDVDRDPRRQPVQRDELDDLIDDDDDAGDGNDAHDAGTLGANYPATH